MDQKENVLSALSRHQIKIDSIQGNCIYTQFDYCIELKAKGIFKLSQQGFVKDDYKDSDQLCEVIKTDDRSKY